MTRVQQIIDQLEKLHDEAHKIFDARVDVIMCSKPYGTSLGATKMNYIMVPAGRTLDYIQALTNLRDGITPKQ
jgi:hypothetical protein